MSAYRSPSDPRTRLPLLDRVAIKTPCTASWDDMVPVGGDDNNNAIRFCCTCSKNVYDLSAMDADAAEAFLQHHLRGDGDEAEGEGRKKEKRDTCVKLFRRPDGRILTSECGPGNRRRHARRAAAVLTAGLAATTLMTVVADRALLPTLNEDAPEWLVDDPPPDVILHSTLMSLGAVAEIGEIEEHPIVRIDEPGLAVQEEPESELLGTSAKTERIASGRRAEREPGVLPGVVRLVTPPTQRF